MADDLDRLKAIFDKHRSEWLAAGREGEWAVVTDSGAEGFFSDYAEAYRAAVAACGQRPYLLQPVLPVDRIESVRHVYW